MKQIIASLFIATLAMFGGALALQPAAAYAAPTKINTKCGASDDVCLSSLPQPAANGDAVQRILSIVIGIVGAVSVLFIAIGGMRYVLSQGDPQGAAKARSTIVFALIGLVVCILAQSIVVVVIKAITK